MQMKFQFSKSTFLIENKLKLLLILKRENHQKNQLKIIHKVSNMTQKQTLAKLTVQICKTPRALHRIKIEVLAMLNRLYNPSKLFKELLPEEVMQCYRL